LILTQEKQPATTCNFTSYDTCLPINSNPRPFLAPYEIDCYTFYFDPLTQNNSNWPYEVCCYEGVLSDLLEYDDCDIDPVLDLYNKTYFNTFNQFRNDCCCLYVFDPSFLSQIGNPDSQPSVTYQEDLPYFPQTPSGDPSPTLYAKGRIAEFTQDLGLLTPSYRSYTPTDVDFRTYIYTKMTENEGNLADTSDYADLKSWRMEWINNLFNPKYSNYITKLSFLCSRVDTEANIDFVLRISGYLFISDIILGILLYLLTTYRFFEKKYYRGEEVELSSLDYERRKSEMASEEKRHSEKKEEKKEEKHHSSERKEEEKKEEKHHSAEKKEEEKEEKKNDE